MGPGFEIDGTQLLQKLMGPGKGIQTHDLMGSACNLTDELDRATTLPPCLENTLTVHRTLPKLLYCTDAKLLQQKKSAKNFGATISSQLFCFEKSTPVQ
jgi:hypothetical protein